MLERVNSFLTMVSLVGIIGNLIVISVYTRKRDRQTSTFFILILAFSDLIVCSVLIPMTIYFENVSFRTSNLLLCKTYFFVTTSTVPASCLLMTAIAFDRYFCICMVNRNIMTPFRAKIVCAILLFVSGMLSVIPTLNAIIEERTVGDDSDDLMTMTTTTMIPMTTDIIKSSSELHLLGKMNITMRAFERTIDALINNPNISSLSAFHDDDSIKYHVCEIALNGNFGSWVMPYKLFYDLIYVCSVIIISILYILIYKKIYTRRKAKRLRKRRLMTNSFLYNGANQMELIKRQSTTLNNHKQQQQQQPRRKSSIAVTRGDILDTFRFIDDDQDCCSQQQHHQHQHQHQQNRLKSTANQHQQQHHSNENQTTTTTTNETTSCCFISMSICFGQFIFNNKHAAANLKKRSATNSNNSSSRSARNYELVPTASSFNNANNASKKSPKKEEEEKEDEEEEFDFTFMTKTTTTTKDSTTTATTKPSINTNNNNCLNKPILVAKQRKSSTTNSTGRRLSISFNLPAAAADDDDDETKKEEKQAEVEKEETGKLQKNGKEISSSPSFTQTTTTTQTTGLNNNASFSMTTMPPPIMMLQNSKMKPLKISIKDIRTAFMLFVVSLLFIVFYLPSILATKSILSNDNLFLVYLYFTNSAINPIIYCFMNRSFRSDLLKLFIKRNRKFLQPTSRFSTLIAISINPNVISKESHHSTIINNTNTNTNHHHHQQQEI